MYEIEVELRSGTRQLAANFRSIIRELTRQIVHVFSGMALLALLWMFGRVELIIFLMAFIIFGLVFLYGRKFVTFRLAERFLGMMERSRFDFGPLYYAVGVLFAASLISDVNRLSAAIVILALGDGFSTMVGKVFGRHRLPYNGNKSVEGFMAFFISASASFAFIGPLGILLAFIGAFLESLDLGIDDNLVVTVPLVILLMFNALA